MGIIRKNKTWKIDRQRHHLKKQIDTSWVEVFSKSSYLIACIQKAKQFHKSLTLTVSPTGYEKRKIDQHWYKL